MKIQDKATTRRHRIEAVTVAGGWVTLTAVFWFDPGYNEPAPNRLWGVGTLVVAMMVGAVMALVVIDTVRAWRSAARVDAVHFCGLALGAGVWLLGGLFSLFLYFMMLHSDYCGGTGGLSSFECLHRPGPVLDTLGMVSAISATPALAALIIVGRRSRVAAWLSPVLIIGLYMLAAFLWEPHTGLGVPHRTVG